MRRLGLIVYTFLPTALMFLLPLAAYKNALPVQLYDVRVLVGGRILLTAVLACLAWFVIAIGIVLWPATPPARPRPWSPPALSAAFVGFSLVGSAASLITSLCAVDVAVAEWLHWASFASVPGATLGVYLLWNPARPGDRPPRNRLISGLILGLIVLDLTVNILVPIGLSKVAPAAVAVIAILYGMYAMGLPARQQLVLGVALCCVIAIALPFKEFLRVALYNGGTFAPRACILTERAAGSGAVQPGVSSAGGRLRVSSAGVIEDLSRAAHEDYPYLVSQFSARSFGLRWPQLGGIGAVIEYAAARTVNRLNRLGDLAYVVGTTPSRVPFAHGSTYLSIVGILVPRAVWPAKPVNDGGGQYYGHRYKFLDPSDKIHSENLPVVTEGWVNAGWMGVLASAAAVGLLLRLVWYWWLGDGAAPGNVVIGMAIVSAAVDQESNLALMVGGVVHALIFYGLLDYLIRHLGGLRRPV